MELPTYKGVTVLALPPDGYEVDFDNPAQNSVPTIYLILGIGGPLAFLALCQRYYTKIWLSKGLQIDDFFIFLAWACSIVTQILIVDSVSKKRMSTHIWEIPFERFVKSRVIVYISAPMFMMCNGFTKLSLLTFYLHLSPQKWFRIPVWTTVVIVALYTIILTLMMFFQCSPPKKGYDLSVEGGSCINVGILFIATAVSNIITDIILLLLPIPMLYQLHMPRAQKIGAFIVFVIGGMTVATSVIRLTLLPPTLTSEDPSWDAAPANVWTFIEANLFIICGSMPTLRKFFKHIAPQIMGSSESRTRSKSNSYAMNLSNINANRSRKQRNQYEHFDDENDNELREFDDRVHSNKQTGASAKVDVVSNSQSAEGDNHSDKAILRSTTVTVRYD